MRPFYPNVKRIPRLYYWIAWALCNLTESSKSPASIAQSNKQWVGTCLYQEWCKPLLISCEATFGYEQVAKLGPVSRAAGIDCEYPLDLTQVKMSGHKNQQKKQEMYTPL